MSPILKQRLLDEVESLPEADQERVLSFARSVKRPRGVSFSELAPFLGTVDAEAAREMRKAVEEGCEGIDRDAW